MRDPNQKIRIWCAKVLPAEEWTTVGELGLENATDEEFEKVCSDSAWELAQADWGYEVVE